MGRSSVFTSCLRAYQTGTFSSYRFRSRGWQTGRLSRNTLGDHAHLRVIVLAGLQQGVFLPGPGCVEDAAEPILDVPHRRLDATEVLAFRQRQTRVDLLDHGDQVTLRRGYAEGTTEFPGGVEHAPGMPVDVLAPDFGGVDDDAAEDASPRPVDTPGTLDEGVDRGALGQQDVVVDVEGDLDDLRGQEQIGAAGH